ncbi:hypothetical protein, partial [Burkholderia sp. SIMBA_024]|uniref:hypothetical protein n=1 Tax=Burkholderia sp. SIMBA_024 TaxID=3085768 RepID=UPI00397B8678
GINNAFVHGSVNGHKDGQHFATDHEAKMSEIDKPSETISTADALRTGYSQYGGYFQMMPTVGQTGQPDPRHGGGQYANT